MSPINTKMLLEEIVKRRAAIVDLWPKDIPDIKQTIEKVRVLDEAGNATILRSIEAGLESLSSDNIIEFVTQVSLKGWHKGGRPSLPMLAHVLAEKLGLINGGIEDSEALSIYDALMLCALRVEAGDTHISHRNSYHNILHFMDVTLMASCLMAHNNVLFDRMEGQKIERLSKESLGITLIAAIIHDLDHPGVSNPPHHLVYNEMQSSLKARFILDVCGLDQDVIHTIHRTLLNTSPNLNEKDHYKTQESDIVEDADLSPSSGWGRDMWYYMSSKLTEEARAGGANETVDYTRPESGLWFFQNIVGQNGYKSEAAKDLIGRHMDALKQELEKQRAESQKSTKILAD